MNPQHARADDPSGITIDRKIPLWGILTLAGGLVGQAVLVWNGQSLQASEIRHQSEQIQDLAKQVAKLSEKFEAKEGIDLEQNLRISELSRRVVALEEQKGRKP